jgi:hypothetical protein
MCRSVQHHGSVTFVSVNKTTGSVHDLSTEFVNGDQRVPYLHSSNDADAFQGSHTLPRKVVSLVLRK